MYPFHIVALIGLASLSILSTTYLYSYPFFHGCAFPTEHTATNARSHSHPVDAPFRLLALGDPQLEGDSSLLDLDDGYFPSLRTLRPDLLSSSSIIDLLAVITHCFKALFDSDIPRVIQSYRKRLDLLGNDYYLAHIYRTVHWFTKPTHVTVLGDLLGSQWVSDGEFERRGQRYWQRVFRHGHRIDDEVTTGIHVSTLGQDRSWETRIINIAGNHDVGYAGDLTPARLERFERVFGKANWETRFNLRRESDGNVSNNIADLPELRIVVLNSLNLDTPALSEELQVETYNFVNNIIHASHPVEDRTTLTLVLTHIPLHKENGVCVDGPHFAFHSDERGGVKEQNHQSYNAGKGILEGIFGMSGNPEAPGRGMGRNGIILTGHDHEGCDIHHYLSGDEDDPPTWKAQKWGEFISHRNKSTPSIREITVRSMMGDFGGNAGLLSAWFDYEIREWRIEYSTCSLGIPHIWWAIHILDLATIGLFLVFGTFQSRSLSATLKAKDSVSGKRESKSQAESRRTSSKATLVPGKFKTFSTGNIRARKKG